MKQKTAGRRSDPHRTVPVQLTVDVDEGIVEEVRWLNTLAGVRTFTSCQGSLGEGGPHPYGPYIMASWPRRHDRAIRRRYVVGDRGVGWAYLHPRRKRKAA